MNFFQFFLLICYNTDYKLFLETKFVILLDSVRELGIFKFGRVKCLFSRRCYFMNFFKILDLLVKFFSRCFNFLHLSG